jgi:Leucine-rich repeat (LRR) protein
MNKTCLLLIALGASLVACKSPTTATAPAVIPGATPALAGTPAPAAASEPATAVKKLEIGEENADLLQRIERYPNLEVLSISCVEGLKAIPDSIGQLTKLKELRMDNGNGCSMNPVLPESMGNLAALETLVLYGAQDPGEPGERGSQPAQHHKFPRSLSQLKNLTYLDLGRNGLEEIPNFVGDLPKLKHLGFGWNIKLREVPSFLTRLPELTSLDLQADGLRDLPDFLNAVPKLAEVRMGDNHAITGNEAKKRELQKRFPKIKFNFDDEYD